MSRKKSNERIFCFGCPHTPYNHKDLIRFIKAIKKKYKPTRAVCLGDERDKHAQNMHDHHPDLDSAGPERIASMKVLKEIEKLFPYLDLIDSNHGSLHLRQAVKSGTPSAYYKALQDVYNVKGWRWYPKLILTLPNGNRCLFKHELGSNIKLEAQKKGMCVVQSHFHTLFEARYSNNTENKYWGATIGCLIDDDSLAFVYNKNNKEAPILGAMMIVNSKPILIPMDLDAKGRWDGKL